MSLSRTIDRLARAIRLEARRNPDFAQRLEAVLAAHAARPSMSSAEVSAELDREEAGPALEAAPAPKLNPVAVVSRQGAEALAETLNGAEFTLEALRSLVAEHNLDPAGEAHALGRADLAAHIVAQAKRRVERDRKLFDY